MYCKKVSHYISYLLAAKKSFVNMQHYNSRKVFSCNCKRAGKAIVMRSEAKQYNARHNGPYGRAMDLN